MPRLARSRLVRVILVVIAAVVALVVVFVASTDWLDTLGATPTGERLARIRRSPNYRDGAFRNPDVTSVCVTGSIWTTVRRWLGGHEQRVPPGELPIITRTRADFLQLFLQAYDGRRDGFQLEARHHLLTLVLITSCAHRPGRPNHADS